MSGPESLQFSGDQHEISQNIEVSANDARNNSVSRRISS